MRAKQYICHQIIDEREVKITNMETAKLLNLPFDPREFQPFAIKATFLTNSGKRETVDLSALPARYGFRITHHSSDGSPIRKPSSCLFGIDDLRNRSQQAQAVAASSLICSPNPFGQQLDVRFYAPVSEPVSLSLYDLQGRLVKVVQAIGTAKQQQMSIDSHSLAVGTYICTLSSASRHSSQKVVKVE